jgi:Mg2+ and Co2+ transporter CorA
MFFLISGVLTFKVILLGSILAIPNFLGNYFGAKFFDPNKNTQYRLFAYIIIAIAAITGLPVWD